MYIQDECSFVSLRDVERAMIVFEWFYENNEFFEKLLKDEPEYEVLTYIYIYILVSSHLVMSFSMVYVVINIGKNEFQNLPNSKSRLELAL